MREVCRNSMYGERAYLDMCQRILEGPYRKPEGEEGRYESFGEQLRFDLQGYKIPVFTTKKTQWKSLAVEMLWFMRGHQDVSFLHQNGVHIWDTWANADGIVGPLYGYMWRHWGIDPRLQHQFGGATEIDQLKEVMKTLRDRPEARSHMITAWRPDWLKAMAIKPCHFNLQFYRIDNRISLVMTQRSCDTFLGVPFNIAQYSLLTHLVADQLGCVADEFIWQGGDVHIYENHVEQVKEQCQRMVLPEPRLLIHRTPDAIDKYEFHDFELADYEHHGVLRGSISPQGTPGEGTAI